VLASVFSRHGGYTSGSAFVDGLRPAVAVGAAGVALAALALLAVPRQGISATDVEAAGTEPLPALA
jgi:hypothetical protein